MSFLEQNLAAVKTASPQTAARVAAAQVPPDFARTPGTDGTTTFSRITTDTNGKKHIEWLGATSMPRASAGSIIASLDPFSNGANGLGLSIGSGFEWAAFAAKLGRAQMVYVYEPDAGMLRMALEICDLSDLVARGRIVLLTGPPAEAADDLAGFLNTHRGYEPPTVLHPLASLTGDRRNHLLAGGEAIVRRAVTERQALEGQLLQQLAATPAPAPSQSQVPVAFLLTPRYPAERPLQHEAARRAAKQIAIDTHDSTSIALRLQTLIDAGSKGVPIIFSDLFRHQLGPIPAQVPVETWIPPLVGAAYWDRLPPTNAFAPHDRVVVHAGRHAERLESHGIPKDRIELRPFNAQPQTVAATPPAFALRHRVALIADLPACDEASLKIELPTHQAVFAAACEMIKADYLSVHPGMAADLLRRALSRAGVDPKADDPTLKDPMLRLVRDVLIPTLPLLTLAATLAAEDLPLTLIGDWPGAERHINPRHLADPARVRHIPFAALQPADWHEVALLAHLSPEGVVSPLLWDAVARHVAIAAPKHAADRYPSSLATLLQPESEFAQVPAQNFVATMKALLRDATRREKLATAAARRIPR